MNRIFIYLPSPRKLHDKISRVYEIFLFNSQCVTAFAAFIYLSAFFNGRHVIIPMLSVLQFPVSYHGHVDFHLHDRAAADTSPPLISHSNYTSSHPPRRRYNTSPPPPEIKNVYRVAVGSET